MPTLHVYPQPDLPALCKWQAIAFMWTEPSDFFKTKESFFLTIFATPEKRGV